MSAFILCAILAQISGWSGGVTKGDIDVTPQVEYIQLDAAGGIHVLTAGKIATKTNSDSGHARVAQFPIQASEQIIDGPIFFSKPVTAAGGKLYAISKTNSGWRQRIAAFDVSGKVSSLQSWESIQHVTLPVYVGTSSPIIAQARAGQVYSASIGAYDSASNWVGTAVGAPFSSDIVALSSRSDSLFCVLSTGQSYFALKNGSSLGSWNSATPSAFLAEAIQSTDWVNIANVPTVAILTASGKLFVGNLSGWSEVAIPEPADEIAMWKDGSAGVIRLRYRSGYLGDVLLPAKSVKWVLHSAIQKNSFTRTSSGTRIAEEAGAAPSGVGIFQKLWSRLWGVYHHRGSLSVSELIVDPYWYSSDSGKKLLVRISSSGTIPATMTLDVVKDSANGSSISSVANSQALISGQNDWLWSGSGFSSGKLWMRAKVQTAQDTLVLWKAFHLDTVKPTGALTLSWMGTAQAGKIRLSEAFPLAIDVSGIKDYPDTSMGWSGLARLTSSKGVNYEWPIGNVAQIKLSGKDAGGVEIPDGSYSLDIQVKDSAGNVKIWNSPWKLIHGSKDTLTASSFEVRGFSGSVGGITSPMPIMASAGYLASLSIRVMGLDSGVLALRSPDGNALVCSNLSYGSVAIPHGIDTTLVIACKLQPGKSGWHSGANLLRAIIRNNAGDTAFGSIPVVLDAIKTVITYPEEGAKVSGTVPVKGVATSNDLGAGFQQYRAWWIKGIVQPASNVKSVQELLGGKSWNPMAVPLSSQQPASQVGNLTSSSDAVWPKSNVGVQDRATNGLLAWFNPASKDTGTYTLLIVSEGSKGLISFDSKRIHWGMSRISSSISLSVVDSSRLKNPSNPFGKMNLRNNVVTDDSLVWGIKAKNGQLDVSAMLVPCDSLGHITADRILDVRSLRVDSSRMMRFVQSGVTGYGQILDSGWYNWRIQAWNDNAGVLQDTQFIFQFIPDTANRQIAISVIPARTRYVASLGAAPKVQFNAGIPVLGLYRLVIQGKSGDSLLLLADSIKVTSGKWSWDFRVNGRIPNGDSIQFKAVLKDLRRSGTPIVATVPFDLLSEQKVLYSDVSMFFDSSSDSIWAPKATTEFKFRALAKGKLAYFPERRVDYAPEVEGVQVVRKFLTVPLGIDYIKFYNSVDFNASSNWELRSYIYHWYKSDEWPTRYISAPSRRGTAWSARWDDRWKLQGQIDSLLAKKYILENAPKDHLADSTYLSTPYYGDLPWIDWLPSAQSDVINGENADEFRKKYETEFRTLNGIDYPNAAVNELSESLRSKLGLACGYIYTLNRNGREPTTNFCSVMTGTNEVAQPGDHWVGVNSGSAELKLVQWDRANPGQVVDGAKILAFEGVSDRGDNPRANLAASSSNLVKKIGNEGTQSPRLYWMKREITDWSNGSNFSLNGDNDWSDDDDQGLYLGPPHFNWNAPNFLLHGQFIDSLNYAEYAMNDSVRQDRVNWSGQGQNAHWNCWDDHNKKHECLNSFGGTKVGIRGFAYQPALPLFDALNGKKYNQFQYIKNFFTRDSGLGLAYWAYPQTHPKNDDQLYFHPVLNVDDSMFRVTWDTMDIPYPLGAYEHAGAMYIEKLGDSILAFHSKDSVDRIPFTQDTARFLRLKAGAAFPPPNANYVDSAQIPLESIFAKLMVLTDTSGRKYGYVRKNSLKFSVPIRSWRIQPDGSLGALDTSSLYFAVDYRSNPFRAVVYYRNHPDTVSNWSSALDTTFRKTNGWIYGGGRYNDSLFRGRAKAMDGNGFLGLINPANMPEKSTSSLSPFFKKFDSLSRKFSTQFNPNLALDSLTWDLEVFHADGSTVNGDLPIQGQSPYNFLLGLDPKSGTRSWIGIRGQIRDTLVVGGQSYKFKDYSVLLRKNDDTSSFQSIPVNRFFTKDSVGDQAIYLPKKGMDPWDRDTLAPTLAWWENTGKVGKHEVAIVAHYARLSDNAIYAVVQRKELVSGNVMTGNTATIDAPYLRASISMPVGTTQAGSSLSLQVIAPSELSQRIDLSKIAPIGPVVQVLTDGKTNFSTDTSAQPMLTYRMSARELYQLEGISGYDTDSIPKILRNVSSLKEKYHLYDLGADGKLVSLPTLVTIDSVPVTGDRDLINMRLLAKVPHFSWIFLQRDDGHGGNRPVLQSVLTTTPNVVVKGLYQDGAVFGVPLFVGKMIPSDLRLSWIGDTSKIIDWSYAHSMNVPVRVDGTFTLNLPLDSLPIGPSTLFLHYDSAKIGSTARVMKESSVLHVWNWADDKQPVIPICGGEAYHVTFSSDRSGTIIRFIQDSTGAIRQTGSFVYEFGDNSIAWDGCLDGVPAKGVFTQRFIFDDSIQNRSMQVSVGRMPTGVAKIVIVPGRFAPSITDPNHGTTVTVLLRSTSTLPVHVAVRTATGILIGKFADLLGNDSVRMMSWNGYVDGNKLVAGNYRIEAWLGADSTTKMDREVVLLTAQSPQETFTSDKDSIQLPLPSGQLKFTTTLPVFVKIKLLSASGDSVGVCSPNSAQKVTNVAYWNWSVVDSTKPVPTHAVAYWRSLDSLSSGIDTARWVLKAVKSGVDSIYSSPKSDTIWPDLNHDLSNAFGTGMPDRLEITAWATKQLKGLLSVRDRIGNAVRIDTINLNIGATNFIWNGRGIKDSVLRTGLYNVELSLLDTSKILHRRTLWLQNLPDLVVVKDQLGLAGRVAQAVAQDGSITVSVWPPKVALAYMQSKPQGAVALTTVPADSSLFTGEPWNAIFRFVRGGGKFGVVGELPLWHKMSATGEDSAPGPMLALLGAASPYSNAATMDAIKTDYIDTGITTNWLDTSVISDLSMLNRLDSLKGLGMRDAALKALPGTFVKISGKQTLWAHLRRKILVTDTIGWTQSFFMRPQLTGGNVDSSGSVLCVHPTSGKLSSVDSIKLSADYGRLIRRYFFGNDLVIARSGVAIKDTVKIGNAFVVRVKPTFIGTISLDSAVMHIVDTSAGIDTAIVFRNLRTGKKLDTSVSILMTRISNPGIHSVTVSLDPFRQYSPLIHDTIIESVTANNSTTLSWVLADTSKPLIIVDSMLFGKLIRKWSPNSDADSIAVHGTVKLHHSFGDLQLSWSLRDMNRMLLLSKSQVIKADTTALYSMSFDPLASLVHGTTYKLRLVVADAFGNRDSIESSVEADSSHPIIDQWTIKNGRGDTAAISSKVRVLVRPALSISDTLLAKAHDDIGPTLMYLRHESSLSPSSSADSSVLGSTGSTSMLAIRPADSLAVWVLDAVDLAGNHTYSRVQAYRNTQPPKVGIWMVTRTVMDSLLKSDSVDPARVQKRTMLVEAKDSSGVRDGSYWVNPNFGKLIALEQNHWEQSLDITKSQKVSFVLEGLATSGVALTVKLDGAVLNVIDSNPYLKSEGVLSLSAKYRKAIATHKYQRYVQFSATRQYHTLEVVAHDSSGLSSTGILHLQMPLADLQIIDSSGDANESGADWGEVYMRRDLTNISGVAAPQTWNYWLLHRRNAMEFGTNDNQIYRIIVDEDADSTTGDTVTALGKTIKGGDVAFEWTGLTGSDNSTGAYLRRLQWNPDTKIWVETSSQLGEGLNALGGYAFHQNEADNLSTDSIGQGDQRLPSGTVAFASGGAVEVGLRSGNSGTLNPIRWALVPMNSVGDSVLGPKKWLTFIPSEFKSVHVDGFTSDWWPNNTPIGVEVRSSTQINADTLSAWIGLRNPGTRTINGIQLKYWIQSDSIPHVSLTGLPLEWRSMAVQSVIRDTSKGVRVWAISLLCGSCALPGGTVVAPLGRLKLWGAGVARSASDDWSYATDSNALNPKLPAYDLFGHILFGSEPPPRTMRLPIARIQPSNTIWTTIGSSIVLSADSSSDPEKKALAYEWWHSSTGIRNQGVSDTFQAVRIGMNHILLRVYDIGAPTREAWTNVDIFVQDSAGSVGMRPVRMDSSYIFDDQWSKDWNEEWPRVTEAVALDSVHAPDGTIRLIRPSRGSSLLSLPLDHMSQALVRGTCTDHLAANRCPNPVDISRYTNIEFRVAMDADMRLPVRIWLTADSNYSSAEEKYVNLNAYLPDPSDASHWQTVSIPLRELMDSTRPKGPYLQLKFMSDYGNARNPHVLFDDIRLVSYATTAGQLVTTRRTSLFVTANTYPKPSYSNEIGMVTRMFNIGQRPIQLDSLRMRIFYHSMAGEVHADTVWGVDTGVISFPLPGVTSDSTLEESQVKKFQLSHLKYQSLNSLVNSWWQYRWIGNTPSADAGLTLRTFGRFSFWTGIDNGIGRREGHEVWGNAVPQYNGTKSLNWSWPDLADYYQTAPHIVIEHQVGDTNWVRMWGYAPGEDPAGVTFWDRENLRDPSEAVSGTAAIKAHITLGLGALVVGANLFATSQASSDPLGHTLQAHWLDSLGHVIKVGSIDSFVPTDTGRYVLRLRIFDITDPTRMSSDSMVIHISPAANRMDSLNILNGRNGTWIPGSTWGTGVTPAVSWKSSVDLPTQDASCPPKLYPVGSDSIMVIPFSNPSLVGVRFDAPSNALDRSKFTHLEFWVASSREWPTRDHHDALVRFWLTHQVAPGAGDDNHGTPEEDFNLVQPYLPAGKLLRRWQKVSIPLDELFQSSLPVNSDSSKLFLKFMLDESFTGRVDDDRRYDLFLSEIRFVKYGSGVRVTTRRVGAVFTGLAYPVGNSSYTRLDFRMLNPTHLSLSSDSLRLRFAYNTPTSYALAFQNNTGGWGTDESVTEDWFRISETQWNLNPVVVDAFGRKASKVTQFTWPTGVPLIGGKGWEAILHFGFNDSIYANGGHSLQYCISDSSKSFSLLTGIVADYKHNGGWSRIWGYEPGENPDTVSFWGLEPLSFPADTVPPVSSLGRGTCNDTIPAAPSNVSTTAGSVAELPSTGRDSVLAIQATTIGGRPAVAITQSLADWNIKHTFVFDSAWAHRSVIDVDVYVDPAELVGSAWAGTMMASTFDHQTWSSLDLIPLNYNALDSAVGRWRTLRFKYDATKYVLGRAFDLMLLANGHGNNTSSFKFAIGSIRLEDAINTDIHDSGKSADTSAVVPDTTHSDISMDSLSSLLSCNQCEVINDGGRTAVAVVPNGGGTALEISVPVTESFRSAHTIALDLKSEFALQDWEKVWFFVDGSPYRYGWDQYLVSMPASINGNWQTIQIPFNGALYGLGSVAKLKLSLNANAPAGKRIYVDNVRFIP